MCEGKDEGPGYEHPVEYPHSQRAHLPVRTIAEIPALGAFVPSKAFLPCLNSFLCNRPMIGRFCPLQMVEVISCLNHGVAVDRDGLGGRRAGKYRERIEFGSHKASGYDFRGGGGRMSERNRARGVAHEIKSGNGWIDVGEIVAAEIRDRELSEDIVKDRGGVLDRVIALHRARGVESG